MIITRYLGAAGVAVFMLGVAAGYTLSGASPAPEAARFKAKIAAPQLTDSAQQQQALIVAIDIMAPGVGRLALANDGSN
jgi:hypothetical protein